MKHKTAKSALTQSELIFSGVSFLVFLALLIVSANTFGSFSATSLSVLFPKLHPAAASEVTVTVSNQVAAVSKLIMGVTHTHAAIDTVSNPNPSALANAKSLIKQGSTFQNVHIMGWGTLNPEPSKGVYDWSSLDKRMSLARELGIPTITLCCAPDWMKGGISGNTDWTLLEKAPLPGNYADYAELAKQVALRYPDVTYFQVWNELKGFWNNTESNWDYVGYTEMYNLVYDAIKSVRPNAKIGGPYLIVQGNPAYPAQSADPITPKNWTVINYWNQHKHGADFVALDFSFGYTIVNKGSSLLEYNQKTHVIGEISKRISDATGGLPIWWAEYYAASSRSDTQYTAAHYAGEYINAALNNCEGMLLWEPQGDAGLTIPHSLFSQITSTGGGVAYPHYAVFKAFHDYFSTGTSLLKTTRSNTLVSAISSPSKTLLANNVDYPVTVYVNNQTVNLSRFEVKVIDVPVSISVTPIPSVTPTVTRTPTPTVTISPTSTPVISGNVLKNSTFETGITPWTFYTNGTGTASIHSGSSDTTNALQIAVTNAGTNTQLYQYDIPLSPAQRYSLSFDGRSVAGSNLTMTVQKHVSPFTLYGLNEYPSDLTSQWQHFETEFVTSGFDSPVSDARLRISATSADEFWIDNVTLTKVDNVGDINLDGHVDLFDLGILASHYGQTITSSSDELTRRCDINNDGMVNIYDLGLLIHQYRQSG